MIKYENVKSKSINRWKYWFIIASYVESNTFVEERLNFGLSFCSEDPTILLIFPHQLLGFGSRLKGGGSVSPDFKKLIG